MFFREREGEGGGGGRYYVLLRFRIEQEDNGKDRQWDAAHIANVQQQ